MEPTTSTSNPSAPSAAPLPPRRRSSAEAVKAEREAKLAQLNLDQRTLDRLQWCAQVAEHRLGIKTSAAVFVRRAVTLYVDALDKLLSKEDADGFIRRAEAVRLKRAAKGEAEKLPDEALSANPPRPFRDIEKAASEQRSKRTRADLYRPIDI